MQLKAFYKLSYGMCIIASKFEEKKAGYIANTVFQVTSEPPQLAISCHKNNATAQVILNSGVFSVSVLKKDAGLKIIGDFGFLSSTEVNKFASVNTTSAQTGAPIVLDGSTAWFDCKVTTSVDLGTHMLIIGEVVDCDNLNEDEPLTYDFYREHYKLSSPKNAPTFIEPSKLNIETQIEKNEIHENVLQPTSEEHICIICGYKYDPELGDPSLGIPPGIEFNDLPDSYKCPICNAGKEYFKKV